MSVSDRIILGWSFLAGLWWLIAIRRVSTPPSTHAINPTTQERITLFKPSPSFHGCPIPSGCQKGLRSFFQEADDELEILIGTHPEDRTAWDQLLGELSREFPKVQWKRVEGTPPARFHNPKINALHTLSSHAKPGLWWWSDLDIQIPAGTLSQFRAEWKKSPKTFLTCAYQVSEIEAASGGWDALYVNAEFLPGALLLGQNGSITTGFGATMLFDSQFFNHSHHWNRIGNSLADDRELALALGPGKLSTLRLFTFSSCSCWSEAWKHYWRWQKTIRWVQPWGYGTQLLILPLAGSLSLLLLGFPWTPLLAIPYLLEIVAGKILLKKLGADPKILPALLLWPGVRLLTWVLTWTPFPVSWSKTVWTKPHYR